MEIEFTAVDESPGEEADAGAGTPRPTGELNGGILNTITGIVWSDNQPTLTSYHAYDLVQVSREQILQLLGPAAFRRIFQAHSRSTGVREGGEESAGLEDDGGYLGLGVRRRRRARAAPKPACPLLPSVEGKQLMDTGIFGSKEKQRIATRQKKPLMASRLMGRELGCGTEHKKANQFISQVRVFTLCQSDLAA